MPGFLCRFSPILSATYSQLRERPYRSRHYCTAAIQLKVRTLIPRYSY
jgi:hypothetical protein